MHPYTILQYASQMNTSLYKELTMLLGNHYTLYSTVPITMVIRSYNHAYYSDNIV